MQDNDFERSRWERKLRHLIRYMSNRTSKRVAGNPSLTVQYRGSLHTYLKHRPLRSAGQKVI
jgi:hypothetical protein